MVLTTKCQVICGDSPSLQHIVGYTVWQMVSRIFELFNQDSLQNNRKILEVDLKEDFAFEYCQIFQMTKFEFQ